MKIGFVSTWGEVGAAYVTKSYIDLLKENHDIYVYPRGIRKNYKKNSIWDLENVENTPNLANTNIKWSHFNRWIKKNELDVIFFNEQVNMLPVLKIKKNYPDIKIGTYVDYYTEEMIPKFKWFDFIICNTQRHYSVFKNIHEQVYYIKWGVDIDLFTENDVKKDGMFTFFHSSGWANRKGTDILLKVFIEYEIYKKSKLLIHTQKGQNIDFDYSKYNIEIVNETISHPGIYHKGDAYVYPTRLEGLGLTMYEALVSGLPLIVPDNGPMNEIVSESNGKLLSVDKFYTRADGYYWPLCESNEESLAEAMNYYIALEDNIVDIKNKIRKNSIKEFNWKDRKQEINYIFENTQIYNHNKLEIEEGIVNYKKNIKKDIGKKILNFSSNKLLHSIARKYLY